MVQRQKRSSSGRSAAGKKVSAWRARSRLRLTSLPHSLRASSQRAYEALVLHGAGGGAEKRNCASAGLQAQAGALGVAREICG